MKASELKPGDYFRFLDPDNGPPSRYETAVYHITFNSGCPLQMQSSNKPEHVWSGYLQTCMNAPVELVPMPGPYVVGKAYRCRDGTKLFYHSSTGLDGSCFQHSHPHVFTDTPGRADCYTTTPNGRISADTGDHEHDIMGEWREEQTPTISYRPGPLRGKSARLVVMDDPMPVPTLRLEVGKRYVRRDGKITGPIAEIHRDYVREGSPFATNGCIYQPDGKHGTKFVKNNPECDIVALYNPTPAILGHQYNQQTGAVEPILAPGVTMSSNKRILPTVTLDQIFDCLVQHDACWLSAGKVTAAARIQNLTAGKTVSARCLHEAAIRHHIPVSDARWLFDKCEALRPEGFVYREPLGTSEFAKALDEWENPKPKAPPISTVKVGDEFIFSKRRYIRIPFHPGIHQDKTDNWVLVYCFDDHSTGYFLPDHTDFTPTVKG